MAGDSIEEPGVETIIVPTELKYTSTELIGAYRCAVLNHDNSVDQLCAGGEQIISSGVRQIPPVRVMFACFGVCRSTAF